ncbi:hypothetical protein [Saccharopolyspora sp. ASAGF58]|uniref:hypothetical protein n=1 Tax=Saccharopolyspora sp. ASAGF58 TaxID=2719023 RepID=UPI001FF0BF6D|nr:hypothetical protein [Saccharopolyspora sp. ASAGF58]
MRENLLLTGSAVVSERINATLAPLLGRATAKKLPGRIAAAATEGRATYEELLTAAPELREAGVSAATVRGLLDPEDYLGAAPLLVDRALARYRRALSST